MPLRAWLLLAGLIAAGCASTSGPGADRPVAHMAIENLTSYVWRIELHPVEGNGETLTIPVEGHDSRTVDVPAGRYDVVQAVATPLARPPAPRRFTADLAAGETYRWPLLTLLSP